MELLVEKNESHYNYNVLFVWKWEVTEYTNNDEPTWMNKFLVYRNHTYLLTDKQLKTITYSKYDHILLCTMIYIYS